MLQLDELLSGLRELGRYLILVAVYSVKTSCSLLYVSLSWHVSFPNTAVGSRVDLPSTHRSPSLLQNRPVIPKQVRLISIFVLLFC